MPFFEVMFSYDVSMFGNKVFEAETAEEAEEMAGKLSSVEALETIKFEEGDTISDFQVVGFGTTEEVIDDEEPPNLADDPCLCASCNKYIGEGSNPGELCLECREDEK